MTRALICGGRDFRDRALFFYEMDVLREKHGITVVIHGGAQGADHLAEAWGLIRGLHVERYAADWGRHGNAAGPIRNQRMIDEGKPDLVVAFPGGRGTADMVRRARAAGIKVIEIEGE